MHEQNLHMGHRVGEALVPGAYLAFSTSQSLSREHFDRIRTVSRNRGSHCQFCISAVYPTIFFGALLAIRVDLGL
jgi:hypothetical protein